jgi:hypothetical protein
VTIPASVRSIGDGAFYDCSGVFSAYFLGNSVSYVGNAFKGNNNTTIYVKYTSTWEEGLEKFGGCTVVKVKITNVVSTPVNINNAFSDSTLSGTPTVDGTFSWVSPILSFTLPGKYNAKFTPTDSTLKKLEYFAYADVDVQFPMQDVVYKLHLAREY